MDKLILFLLIIVLILCFKNVNVMVKKSDEDVIKVIIVLIIIGLIFMCKGDLVEGILSGNTGLDPACGGITCSKDRGEPGECLDTSNMKCSGNMPDNGKCPQGFVNCSGGDSGGGDSGGGDSGGGDSGGGDTGGDSDSSPYIQFLNKTGEDMYIYFDKDPRESGRVFNPSVNPVGNTTFKIKVSNNQTFNISSSSNIIGNWFGGECSITNKESYAANDNMNHAGLTSFEWSIDNANNTVSANISNVSGANVNGEMNISGLNCDKNTSVNKMELDTDSANGCYKDFGIMTGGAGDIPACSIKIKGGINTSPKDSLICGDNNECLGCKLDEGCDWSADGHFRGACYASILRRKYGCLEWWTNNELAIKWKKYNTDNRSDAYWWGMGEQILGNNTYNNEIIYDGSTLDDKAVNCINGSIKDQNTCQGYIITNPDGSLRTCKRDNSTTPFMIKFTINKIMKIMKK